LDTPSYIHERRERTRGVVVSLAQWPLLLYFTLLYLTLLVFVIKF